MARSLAPQTGRPPGMKPVHGVVGAVVLVLWFGLAAFVLTHGRGDASGVDVYSELPPGFTTELQSRGVTYSGLSSVDATTVKAVLATASGSGATGSSPLVFRTSLSSTRPLGSKKFTDQPALMVVVPGVQPSQGTSATSVFVEFVDPITFSVLTQLTYGGSATASATPSG